MIYLAVFLSFEESCGTIGNPSGIIRLYGGIHGNNTAFEKNSYRRSQKPLLLWISFTVSKTAQLQIMGTNSGAKSDCSMLCPFVNNYYYMKQSSSHRREHLGDRKKQSMFYSEFWESVMKTTCILYCMFNKLTPFIVFSFSLRGQLWMFPKTRRKQYQTKSSAFLGHVSSSNISCKYICLTVAIFMAQGTLSVALYQ